MLKRALIVAALAAVTFATATVRPAEAKRGEPQFFFSVKNMNMNAPPGPRIKATTQPRQLPAVQKIRTRHVLEPPGSQPYSLGRHTLFVREHIRRSSPRYFNGFVGRFSAGQVGPRY